MKIAICGSFNFHVECLGFLLHLLRDHEIFIFLKEDAYMYIPYFQKSLNVDFKVFSHTLYSSNKYDATIKLTSNDPIASSEGVISIAHLKQFSDDKNNFISLTPYIYGDNIKYIFPLYRGLTNLSRNKIITYIGYCLPSYIDNDLISFINNSVYKFNFIVYEPKVINELRKFKNVLYAGIAETNNMVDIILESQFILIRKLPYQLTDRFSGSLSLAVSHKKPVIIQKCFYDTYKIPGLLFDKNYTELTETLNTLKDNGYDDLVNSMELFIEETDKTNKDRMNSLIGL